MSGLISVLGGELPDIDTTVRLVLDGITWSGWEDVRIQRGVEICPGNFDVRLTERTGSDDTVVVIPGANVQVFIGNTEVIRGFIDVYGIEGSPESHEIHIAGRSRCCDLVDTHAVVPEGQLGNVDILTLAEQLCALYGISVFGQDLPIEALGILQYFNVTLGQTPFEIIEMCARYFGVLVYDDTDGNLLLAAVGTRQHASGFSEGVNVQDAAVTYRMDERMSVYLPVLFSVQQFNDFSNANAGNTYPPVYDRGVSRFRPYYVVSEQFVGDVALAQRRALWEMQRRRGRSQAVTFFCDSWHDSSGRLWTPNYLAPVNLPTWKIRNAMWVITEVNFLKGGERGTGAEITMMPPEALTVEPSAQFAFDPQLQQALDGTSIPASGSAS